MTSDSTPAYRKVIGGGFTWKGHGRVWLTHDHLLEVDSLFISESYRRFFFQDIQAFVVQSTNVRRIWGWLFGVAALVTGAAAGALAWSAYSNWEEDWHVALYFPAGFFGLVALTSLILWILNLTFGPSCSCQVLTPTGWYALSAPRRLGPAGRAQAEIAAVIQAVQGPPPSPSTPPPPPVATP